MPMPPNPEELALQGALSGGAGAEELPPAEGGGEDEELQLLMQLIEELKATGDPKVMAILEQLMALQQQPPVPTDDLEGAEPPME